MVLLAFYTLCETYQYIPLQGP